MVSFLIVTETGGAVSQNEGSENFKACSKQRKGYRSGNWFGTLTLLYNPRFGEWETSQSRLEVRESLGWIPKLVGEAVRRDGLPSFLAFKRISFSIDLWHSPTITPVFAFLQTTVRELDLAVKLAQAIRCLIPFAL